MSKSPDEILGIAWLPAMIAKAKSEPMFDEARWNQILAELGRITVYFDILETNLKLLLCALKGDPLDMTRHARKMAGGLIEKCKKALAKLETKLIGKNPTLLVQLCKDCRVELDKCDKFNDRRNELIHALWSPAAFPPHTATRFRPEKAPSGLYVTNPQGHDAAELQTVAIDIRNEGSEIHAFALRFWAYFNV